MPAESNPAAVLAFDAAVIRAQAPRIGDKPLPPSASTSTSTADAIERSVADVTPSQGSAA